MIYTSQCKNHRVLKHTTMKWAYSFRRKINAALLLAAIFVLLFVKNMLDSKNVSQLGSFFSTVYEDRLVVESYIYRMSEHLFRKKIMIDTAENLQSAREIRPVIVQYNHSIAALIDAYEKTRLTKTEATYFSEFKKNVGTLADFEREYFAAITKGKFDKEARRRIDRQLNEASNNLDRLSVIQISEGKILHDNTQRIVAGSSILTQFETGILIAVGLMVLVLAFESTALFSTTAGKASLN